MFSLQTIESWITQLFNPAIGEYGQDYAVPVGTPIYSPVGGVVSTQDMGKQDWGKRVIVSTSDAAANAAGVFQFAVGHLTKFAVTPGEVIQPGQLIGWSGGATSDPSSGDSSGPHVEPQFLGKNGAPINPKTVFAQFSSWESEIFNGITGSASGMSRGSASSSSGGDNLVSLNFPGGNLNVPDPFAGAGSALSKIVTRGFAFLISVPLIVIGLFLIVSGDFEKLGERAADAVEKVAPAAAAVAE